MSQPVVSKQGRMAVEPRHKITESELLIEVVRRSRQKRIPAETGFLHAVFFTGTSTFGGPFLQFQFGRTRKDQLRPGRNLGFVKDLGYRSRTLEEVLRKLIDDRLLVRENGHFVPCTKLIKRHRQSRQIERPLSDSLDGMGVLLQNACQNFDPQDERTFRHNLRLTKNGRFRANIKNRSKKGSRKARF